GGAPVNRTADLGKSEGEDAEGSRAVQGAVTGRQAGPSDAVRVQAALAAAGDAEWVVVSAPQHLAAVMERARERLAQARREAARSGGAATDEVATEEGAADEDVPEEGVPEEGVPEEADPAASTLPHPGDALPTRTALLPAYPNPFNPTATVPFELAEAGAVRLSVYDLLGREVARLVDGRAEAGRHTAVFDASALPSGTYLVRFEAGGRVQTQRLTLLK